MTMRSEEPCWLCGALENLTLEHLPPRSSFNASPVSYQGVSESAIADGYIDWEVQGHHHDGYVKRSLCARCNQMGGRVFVPSFQKFTHALAEAVSVRGPLTSVQVKGVRNPQLILRQIMMQFVSANGADFVDANPWVRRFLMSRDTVALPSEVRIYIFATKSRLFRTTGISGHVRIPHKDFRIVSEFTYWPVGTVLSYSELSDEPLLDITSWSTLPFKSRTSLDLTIPVNPVASALPIDFRDDLDIWLDMHKSATELPDEELVRLMTAEMIRIGGHPDNDRTILTASPSAVDLWRRTQIHQK